MNERANDRVIIFDTTLRDGEQAPGCSMTLREKLRVAVALRDLQVDVIEAGFAAASPGDFESVATIAKEIEGPIICSLARCHPNDIEKAAKAVAPAEHKRVHVFVATSEIHRKYKLEMAKDEIIKRAVDAVRMAREVCDDVEFSPEDASRTEPAYLADVVAAVIAPIAALSALLIWGVANAPDRGADAGLAPDFTIQTFDHGNLTLSDLRGVVVLVDFWGSWCPPCREEFPSLERLQVKLKSRDFTVLAITVADTREGVERFLDGRTPDFDILLDETDATAQAFRATGVPVTYLLDRQGRLLAGKAGPHQWDDPDVVKLIERALNETGGK